ncbi:zinc-dependent alcohol dehydrogenase [Candidatus Darwinibacter acetoxidans]|jgi:L-iditol 2-dehydrogenase
MKALVLKEYHQLSYEDVPEPHYGPDDLLVQVKACAICGSDVHGLDGSTGRRQPPIIMGHEASGVVAAVGERVQGFAPGDRITFDSTIYCGRCHFCRQGRINLCDNRRVLGVSCDDYRQNGALAEFVAVPSHIAYHLPEGVSFEQAALVEPVSIAVHAVSLAPLNLGDTAVVVGVGTIGLLIIQILRTAGCGQIIALDIDHGKFDLARRFGAAVCWDPREEDLIHRIRSVTKGRGADLAFDAVGLSFTVGQAAGLLRKGGALVLVGNLSPQADLPLQSVVTREIALYGSCASSGEYPICLELIQQGKVDVNSLISATAPLRDGAEWFQRLYNKEPGLLKVVLKP